jgi:integrase
MRAYMRDIFAEAADQDFLAKDPARKVRGPTQLRETDKTTLTWDQLRKALSELNVRDRLLLELDMTNALRPSELFGLRWKSFNEAAATMSHGDCLQGQNPSLGQDAAKPHHGAPAKRPGSANRGVEATVSRFVP